MKLIKLTQGQVAKIDNDDYHLVKEKKWCANYLRNVKGYYAVSGGGVLMHRVILNAPKGVFVDHINGDTLDNRRSNLRFATRSENGINSRKKKAGSSKYKGVYLDKRENRTNRWRAEVQRNGTRYCLGSYKNEIDAAIAVNNFIKKHDGDFACLNEII